MDSTDGKVIRTVSLRKKRRSIVSGLQPGDRVTAAWDDELWEWRLVIESANGLIIRHVRLTTEANKA